MDEQSHSPTTPGGVGPELIHETGYWVPTDIVPNLAQYLAAQTSVPKPVITGLDVVFDPRRQLGDVVTISSTRLLGTTMTALVAGVDTSADASGIQQSLSVRIISVTAATQTYQGFNDSLAGSPLTYAQLQTLGPLPETYSQFNTSP